MKAMLESNSLFLNSRKNFNDPFDSRPRIKDDLSPLAIRDYSDEMLRNPVRNNQDPAFIAELLELKRRGARLLDKRSIREIKNESIKNATEFLDNGGLLSFSLNPEHPLLWGHYCSSYSGVCAVFRRGTSHKSALSVCAKVTYVDKQPLLPMSLLLDLARRQRASLPYKHLADEVFFRSFLHKSSQWSYEEEARIFHPFKAMQKLQFERNELRALLIGPNATPELETSLRSEARAAKSPVEIHRTHLSEREFRIVIPHNFLRSRKRDSF